MILKQWWAPTMTATTGLQQQFLDLSVWHPILKTIIKSRNMWIVIVKINLFKNKFFN